MEPNELGGVVWQIVVREPRMGWNRLGQPSGNLRMVRRGRWMAKNSAGQQAMFDRKRDAQAWAK